MHPIPTRRVALCSLLAVAAIGQVAARLPAQCDPVWVAAGSSFGADDRVRDAVLWDPDGPGPTPVQLVVAGDFRFVTDTIAPLIAMQDTQTGQWQSLGSGLNGFSMHRLAVLATGELVVAGVFTTAGSGTIGIARWSGATWVPFGNGRSGDVLIAEPNGDLLAANNAIPQSQWVGAVERWNGSAWTQVAPTVEGRIAAMVQLPNGDLVVAGQFLSANGVAAQNIARWNGASWSPLGTGLGSAVNALAVLPNGDVVAGGYFLDAGGQPATRIARWNGVAWQPMGSGITGASFPAVWSLRTLANGDLIVGGRFDTAGGVAASDVARWQNGTWSALGSGVNGEVDASVELPNGDVLVGGTFTASATVAVNRLARWNGTSWSAFGAAPLCNGAVSASAVAPNGDLVIAGDFTVVSGQSAVHVARRTGSGWTALGGGITGLVRAVGTLATGDVIAAGSFTSAGGVAANNIARWDGVAWSPLGAGTNAEVRALTVLSNGDLIAGGSFTAAGGQGATYAARWNGTTWSPLAGGPSLPVVAMTVQTNGELAVAASTSPFLTSFERWNGTAWSTFSSLSATSVAAMLTMPNGDLMVGGFVIGTGLLRWDGSNWNSVQLGAGSSVNALALLPDGDLLAAGTLVIGAPNTRLGRWNGASWTPLESGSSFQLSTLAVLPHGEVAVGGTFQTIGELVSPFFASLIAPCAATAVPFGSGCVGSNGPLQLTATQLPWVGSTFRARATGLPGSSFVATISGLTPLAVPLNLLFAQAGPGCTGHNSGEVIEVAFPVGGTITTQIALPNTASLVGLTFDQYVMAFEFNGLGALVDVTSTNALAMTLGVF